GMTEKVEAASAIVEPEAELRALMATHFDFVWRSLRRLGVEDSALEDAAQKVWIIVSNKGRVRHESARAYLFSIAVRVASGFRRSTRRGKLVSDDDAVEAATDHGELPDEQIDHARARAILDQILDAMDDDLRAVFVLFELEQMTSPEIA